MRQIKNFWRKVATTGLLFALLGLFVPTLVACAPAPESGPEYTLVYEGQCTALVPSDRIITPSGVIDSVGLGIVSWDASGHQTRFTPGYYFVYRVNHVTFERIGFVLSPIPILNSAQESAR